MAASASAAHQFLHTTSFSLHRHVGNSFKVLCFLLIFVAFTSSVFHFLYVSTESKLHIDHPGGLTRPRFSQFSKIDPQETVRIAYPQQIVVDDYPMELRDDIVMQDITGVPESVEGVTDHEIAETRTEVGPILEKDEKNDDVYHDTSLFVQDYKEMNKSLKIYTYPHNKNDPFANIFLPQNSAPGGNYASESYFKKALFNSHFLTSDPSKADLFFLPFSIASLRHDKRVGVGGIQDFVKNYVANISRNYPYWNRTGGADHFYVACHSVGRTAMEKTEKVKINAIQVVCSSSYFLAGYVAHKDASVPQIWPREGNPPTRSPAKRKNLAFYAGAMNSRVRQSLVKTWQNDSDISVHSSRLKTSYSEALLSSKFCIHAKGFEVNTARIGDALYYGCVPVILADHYDLPYTDVLNWSSFAVIVTTSDIPILKKVLENISGDEYLKMQGNVMRVQKHFQWHSLSVDYDAFYMVMFELWLRRSHVRIL